MIRFFLTLTVALTVALTVSLPAAAQRNGPRAPFVPPKDGNFDLFRALLHFHGVTPLTTDDFDDLQNRDLSKVILVVLGCSERDGHGVFEGYARRVVRNGGALLIATDSYAELGGYFVDNSDVSVSGNPTMARLRTDCYFGDAFFPFLQLANRPATDETFAELFQSRPRIAANRPSTLRIKALGSRLNQFVGTTPPNGDGVSHPFMAGGVGEGANRYRALVMADPDVLSNQMIYSSGLPDHTGLATDNWTFANALVKDFLREPNGRDKCLFVEAGLVRTDFNRVELKAIQGLSPAPVIPLPNPLDRRVQEKLAQLVDNGVVTFEDREIADKLLAGRPDDPDQRRYQATLSVLASILGVVLVALMVRRLFTARHRRNFVPAPSDPLFLGDETALGSFGQRRAELLRGNDFRAAVSHAVRYLFTQRGLPAHFGDRRLPPVEFRRRGDRDRLAGPIRELWGAAARDEARPLSYSEWRDLEPLLAEVHAAAEADRWRFAPTLAQGPA